jgi:hypothetical protein
MLSLITSQTLLYSLILWQTNMGVTLSQVSVTEDPPVCTFPSSTMFSSTKLTLFRQALVLASVAVSLP